MSEVVISRLQEQEVIIERGLASVFEVGNALRLIRDDQLYREAGFGGFVEYLDSKPWGIGQAEAYRQIQGAQVVEVLDLPNPVNVAQAEALAPLLRHATPEVTQQVYAEVVEETGGKPTARAIREKVAEVLPSRTSSNGYSDPRVIQEALDALELFNKLSARITPELLGRISQSVCKRYESRAAVAETHLANQRAELRPRLDSLTPTRRG